MNRVVTLQDIAKDLGISKMTVSAVLSGKADNLRISKNTQSRVTEAAQRLGYRPNELARSLRRRFTNIIGFYVGHIGISASDPWLSEIIVGLQEGCGACQKDLLLHSISPIDEEEAIYTSLTNGRSDGLVYYGPKNTPLVERLCASSIPVVAIVDALPQIPSVVGDDVSGSRKIVEFLAQEGHKRVLYCSQIMEASSVHQRQDIFFKEAQRHGIIVDNWDVVKIGKEKELLEHWRQLPTERRWTALVAWDDLTAYRIWATCHREGVSVPKDFGIIGFDGISSSTSLLQLTTVRVPWREVAQQAIHNLVAMVDGVEVLPLKVLPVEFVTGNST